MSPVRRKGLGCEVGVGESALRIEQVVLQRERAALAAARATVAGCWLSPQPPSPIPVLWAARCSRLGAAHLAASLALPGSGAAARLAPGARETRKHMRARRPRGLPGEQPRRLASPRLAVNSEVQRQAESKGARAPGGLSPGRTPSRLGDARGPTSWHPDGPGLAAAGAGAGCTSLSSTALAASGSNSSHLLIRES